MSQTVILVAAPILIQLLTAAYVYGKLTSEVSTVKTTAATLAVKVDSHETRIAHIEGAL